MVHQMDILPGTQLIVEKPNEIHGALVKFVKSRKESGDDDSRHGFFLFYLLSNMLDIRTQNLIVISFLKIIGSAVDNECCCVFRL